MRILHITTHTGGGVGTVILNWVLKDNSSEHTIMLLGYADEKTVELCYANNIKLYEKASKDYAFICSEIEDSDIVVIHYWNHPLLLDFLINNKLPQCRIITWLHTSGLNAPYSLPKQIVEMSDKFVFTSPISYELDIARIPKYCNKFTDIWSTGGVEKYINVKHRRHEGFNILYVGTLDFSKIREDYIFICSQILKEIPEATIILCGNGSSMQEMIGQVNDLGLHDRIIFKGHVSDLIPYYEVADCFLYLLDSNHYGTCEQVLGEVMSCGIVPIVFNNACEKEIVNNNAIGYIVSTVAECISSIKEIYKDTRPDNKNVKIYTTYMKELIQEKYSIDKMIDKWNKLFDEIILEDKKEREWQTNFTNIYGLGTIAFLESLDNDIAKLFHEYISYERQIEQLFKSNLQWHSDSKGSIKQYLKFFPNDKYLNKFQQIMDEDIL